MRADIRELCFYYVVNAFKMLLVTNHQTSIGNSSKLGRSTNASVGQSGKCA